MFVFKKDKEREKKAAAELKKLKLTVLARLTDIVDEGDEWEMKALLEALEPLANAGHLLDRLGYFES